MSTTTPRPSARERLLASADELFFAHGIHVVGIDRLLEHAEVSKASLYKQFGSKDELVRAYLEQRHERRLARWDRHVAAADDARGRLLALFAAQAEAFEENGLRGCAFLRAAAEAEPGDAALDVTERYRREQHERLVAQATDPGARDPEQQADQLTLLYDGGSASAQLDGTGAAITQARAIAATVVDAALREPRDDGAQAARTS